MEFVLPAKCSSLSPDSASSGSCGAARHWLCRAWVHQSAKTSPSYALPHALSPDQVFMHQRPVMAVAANGQARVGPVQADAPDQAAQVAPDLLAGWHLA